MAILVSQALLRENKKVRQQNFTQKSIEFTISAILI